MKRVFVPGAATGSARLEGPAFHHLAVVLRVKAGEALEVFDGHGNAFDATVVTVDDAALSLSLGPARAMPAPRPITLVQGLVRAEKLELVLQKGTELGASAFLPAAARRSVVKLEGKEPKKLERWRRIVEEAARQCGRADVPEVLPPSSLEAVVLPGAALLVLDEEERGLSLSQAVRALDADRPLALVVGPEGGLDRAEVAALVARGAQPVTLGGHVLRTETAGLAALTIVRHLDGLLG